MGGGRGAQPPLPPRFSPRVFAQDLYDYLFSNKD